MKAVCINGYGGCNKLELCEVAVPVPSPTEILLKIKATSLNPIDWKLRKGHLRIVWPLKFPFIPGFDVAGIVQSVGKRVTLWKPGDAVYAALPNGGGQAEFVKCDQAVCARIPPALTFDEAAAIPGAALPALQSLRDIANVQRGHHVIINGASGGVGTFAVQIAVAFECRVTAVTSTRNVELVRSLGAHAVVNYMCDNVLESGPCDVFFDIVPNQSIRKCSRMLGPDGTYVTTLPGPGPLNWKTLTTAGRLLRYRKRCGWLIVNPNGNDLESLNSLVMGGNLRPIIESTYDLVEIRGANEQSESGHTRGKIVLRVQ